LTAAAWPLCSNSCDDQCCESMQGQKQQHSLRHCPGGDQHLGERACSSSSSGSAADRSVAASSSSTQHEANFSGVDWQLVDSVSRQLHRLHGLS
jgi:hypothetical protein